MTRPNEALNYVNNKKQIFLQLIDAIDEAHSTRRRQIYLKEIKVLEETINVMAKRNEWPSILQKALVFFESTEDYEACQRCKTLEESLKTKKKRDVNDETTTTKRNKKT